MNKINVVIADDEELALQRLRKFISIYDNLEIVGEARNGQEVSQLIENMSVDVLFLDIEMPGKSGLELVKALPENKRPYIVFVTAYNQYAVQAFEMYALDYLLKPFNKKRFETTINRIKTAFEGDKSNKLSEKMEAMMEYFERGSDKKAFITVKLANKYFRIYLNDIEYVISSGNYCEIFHNSSKHLIREKISAFIEQLPDKQFLRVHKSHIINMDYVKELISIGYGDYEVKMKDEKKLRVSRSYKKEILPYFNL